MTAHRIICCKGTIGGLQWAYAIVQKSAAPKLKQAPELTEAFFVMVQDMAIFSSAWTSSPQETSISRTQAPLFPLMSIQPACCLLQNSVALLCLAKVHERTLHMPVVRQATLCASKLCPHANWRWDRRAVGMRFHAGKQGSGDRG